MKPDTIIGPPTTTEINHRIQQLQTKLTKQGLDYYICQNPDNIFYLTNFANFIHERPFLLIIPAKGKLVFLLPKLEESHVKIRSVGDIELVNYFEFPAPKGQDWSDKLTSLLPPNKTIGIESDCPAYLSQFLGPKTYVSNIVEQLREIKSSYEIGKIQYTCQLLSNGHKELLACAKPDMMSIQGHSQVSRSMTQSMLMDDPHSNMLNSSFAAVTQPPSVSHDPHNFTNAFMTMSTGGPHVTVVSGKANGYGAELERTFFINNVPENTKKPFNDMLEARALAFELAKPGQCMSDLDQQVNELLKRKGYAKHLLHRTGHSFGVTNHEGPFLAEGYEHIIRENMVFSIEPGIYIEGLGGFRFSDTVLITASGNLCMTQAPETLDALTLRPS